MDMPTDATFYVPRPPDISFAEGLFHIAYDIGRKERFEVVLTPNVFLKALRRANRCADEFHEAGSEVVPLRKRGGGAH